MLQFMSEGCQLTGFLPASESSVYCSIQTFSRLDEAHPHCGEQSAFLKVHWFKIQSLQKHPHRNIQNNVWPSIYETDDPLKLTHEGNHHIHLENCDLDGGQTTSKGPELFLNYLLFAPANLLSRLFTRTGPAVSFNRVCRAWGQPEDSSWRIIYCCLGHQDLALSSKYPERPGIHGYLASPPCVPLHGWPAALRSMVL